jgi:O-antigen ligase
MGAFRITYFTSIAFCFATVWLTPFAPAPSGYAVPWFVCGFAASAALLCLGAAQLDRATFVRAAAWGCAIAGVLSAIIGLAQYSGVAGQWADLTDGWINAGQKAEAYGHLRQRNLFATLTNIALACIAYLIAGHESVHPQCPPQRPPAALTFLWGSAAVLLVWANVASASRTGMVQVVFMCGLVMVVALLGKIPRPWLHRSIFVLVAYLVGLWLVPLLWGSHGAITALDRMQPSGGCENRVVLWLNVMELISQRPWLGWGWGELDWAHHMAAYEWTLFGRSHRFCALLDNAHNLFLHLAVEGGVPLSAAVLGACGWLAWKHGPHTRSAPEHQLAWAILVLIGFHSQLEYPLWYGPFVMVSAMSLVLVLMPSLPIRPKITRTACFGGSLALATVFSSICLDYLRVSQYFMPQERRFAWIETPSVHQAAPNWLFQPQLDFARLVTTTVTRGNAIEMQSLALRVMHYSPEPRVIEQLLMSALLTGDEELYRLHAARYKQAYPEAYAKWRSAALSFPAAGASRL